MSTTRNDPQIHVALRGDGTGQLVVHGRREAIRTGSLDDARDRALEEVERIARRRDENVRFLITDPDGAWNLVMAPDGRVAEDVAGVTTAVVPDGESAVRSDPADQAAPVPAVGDAKPSAPPPAPAADQPFAAPAATSANGTSIPGDPAATSQARPYDRPTDDPPPPPSVPQEHPMPSRPDLAPAGTTPRSVRPQQPGGAQAGPATDAGPERRADSRYDSGYVLDVILPVTRIPKATRGWRAKLGLGPSRSELAERMDRSAICTPFGRPVTIVVADPRGGSGKTTSSLLLAGAFGTARGGGVLALENHELRGTMHLRTDAHASSATIRELLAAQARQEIAPDTVRLGDLSRFVRHQVSGQYDVLVSATKKGRALRESEFNQVHALASRLYWVIIVDTANNESAENWQAAIAKADALLVPVKWRNDYSLPAIEMLEELQAAGPAGADLVSRAVVVASHGPGDRDERCRSQLKPYFEARTRAVIEIDPDPHIAEGNAIQHDQLLPSTRRQAMRVAAEIAQAILSKDHPDAGR